MSFETIRLRLFNAQQSCKALNDLWQTLKPWVMAGHRLHVTVSADNRTLEQNSKFHAICSDIAKAGTKWAGKPRNAAQWKVLLVSGHAIATQEGSDVVPGLEGEFINLRESTALMSVRRGSSLIEYSIAWCAANGVRLSAPEYEEAVA